jgi:hypothetical protein
MKWYLGSVVYLTMLRNCFGSNMSVTADAKNYCHLSFQLTDGAVILYHNFKWHFKVILCILNLSFR